MKFGIKIWFILFIAFRVFSAKSGKLPLITEMDLVTPDLSESFNFKIRAF